MILVLIGGIHNESFSFKYFFFFRQTVEQKDYTERTDFQMKSYYDLLILGMVKTCLLLILKPEEQQKRCYYPTPCCYVYLGPVRW